MARYPTIPAPEGFYGCTICRQIKPRSEFRLRGDGKIHSHCKSCKSGSKAFCLPKNRRRQFTGAPTERDVARFWQYVDQRGPGECWEWIGHTRGGYGNFWLKGRMVNAHRAVFLLYGIELPEWPMVVDHMCRNKRCVNREHLRVVRQVDNVGKFSLRLPGRPGTPREV